MVVLPHYPTVSEWLPFSLFGKPLEVLSQDVRSCADIFSLVLDLVCTLGRDRRGVGPWPLPRIPTTSSSSLLPIPLHGLLLRTYGGGWGGKDDPIDWVVKGPAVSCPIPKKTIVIVMAKGPWSHGPCAPHIHFALHVQNCMQQAERQSLEGEAEKKERTQTRKGRTKRQKPRGVFRVWVPGWHTHIQHSSPIHIASHCAETRPNFPVIPWN